MRAEEFRKWRDGVIEAKGGCCVRCGSRSSLELCRFDGKGRKVSKVRSFAENEKEAEERQVYCSRCRRALTPHPGTGNSEHYKKYTKKRAIWLRDVWRPQVIADKGGVCVDCGSSDNLELDHVEASLKSFPLSSAHCRSLAALNDEAAKCVPRCNRCHIEKSKTD